MDLKTNKVYFSEYKFKQNIYTHLSHPFSVNESSQNRMQTHLALQIRKQQQKQRG